MKTTKSLRPVQVPLILGLIIVHPEVQLKDARKNKAESSLDLSTENSVNHTVKIALK
jgi:hypothetical protein